MLKKTAIAAGAIAVTMLVYQPTPAKADVSFQFQFGNGGHGSSYQRQRLTCREARRVLRRHYGFRRINAIECNGRRYTFRARRDGDMWRVKVNAYTGEVVRMRRI